MCLNFLIHFVWLCSANPSISFANKIAFSSQRNQLKRFDSGCTCGDAIYEVLLFFYASPYRCRKTLIGVELLIIPTLSFRMLQKSLGLKLSLFP